MKAGKLSAAELDRSVLRQLHAGRGEIISGPAEGCDFSLVKLQSGGTLVGAVSTAPVTGACSVDFAVSEAINNVCCGGAAPIGILINLFMSTTASEQTLRDIIGETDRVCARENVAVINVNVENMRTVAEPTLSVTAIGEKAEENIFANDACPGMDLVVTGKIALAGTNILANKRKGELSRHFSQEFTEKAEKMSVCCSAQQEAISAWQCGAAAVQNVSEGGVYAALWNLAQRCGSGLTVDLKKIPVAQETIEICEYFSINPYKLYSHSCLIIAADDGEALVLALKQSGHTAAVVGKLTDGNDRIILCDDDCRHLETPQTDELWKIITK
ncbi:MAG: AIR synthase related protein [Clostridiales bacterium]|nr:AIR synthase related protein [Clostridiales bacterium]